MEDLKNFVIEKDYESSEARKVNMGVKGAKYFNAVDHGLIANGIELLDWRTNRIAFHDLPLEKQEPSIVKLFQYYGYDIDLGTYRSVSKKQKWVLSEYLSKDCYADNVVAVTGHKLSLQGLGELRNEHGVFSIKYHQNSELFRYKDDDYGTIHLLHWNGHWLWELGISFIAVNTKFNIYRQFDYYNQEGYPQSKQDVFCLIRDDLQQRLNNGYSGAYPDVKEIKSQIKWLNTLIEPQQIQLF